MKIHFLIAIIFFTANCAAQDSFTCNYGQRAACLGYGDRVVDSNAACFNQYACGIGGGFVCKSKLDEAMDEYNTLVGKYNELQNMHKELAGTGSSLRDSYRALESGLGECNRKYRRLTDELSESQERLRRSLNEASELRNENLRLMAEVATLRQGKRKSKQ